MFFCDCQGKTLKLEKKNYWGRKLAFGEKNFQAVKEVDVFT